MGGSPATTDPLVALRLSWGLGRLVLGSYMHFRAFASALDIHAVALAQGLCLSSLCCAKLVPNRRRQDPGDSPAAGPSSAWSRLARGRASMIPWGSARCPAPPAMVQAPFKASSAWTLMRWRAYRLPSAASRCERRWLWLSAAGTRLMWPGLGSKLSDARLLASTHRHSCLPPFLQ